MSDTAQATGVRFDSCLRFQMEPGWTSRPHHHGGCHELVLPLEGKLRTSVGNRKISAEPGQVMLYPGDLLHAPRAHGPKPLVMIVLRWTGGENLADLDEPDVRVDRQGRIRRQMEWILDIHPSRHGADRRTCEALTHTVVHELGRLQNPAHSALAERIRRFIREHLQEDISLDDLAREARLSKYHFARKFKRITGQTPMSLVNQMRIEAARSLILQTDLTLDAVAAQVGLADASHLSHAFRRLTGRTPGSLRREGA